MEGVVSALHNRMIILLVGMAQNRCENNRVIMLIAVI